MIKLLIVDDEQIERDGMDAILTKHFPHIIIKQAKNGLVAMELAVEFKPDLILMDIKMPGMTGIEAVEQISTEHPSIKFIMVTAYDTFEYMRKAIKLGVKDYLLKPSKAGDIVLTVGKVLAQIEEERHLLAEKKQQEAAWQRALALVETDVVTQLLFDHVHEVHVDMLVEMLDIPSTDEMFIMIVVLPAGSDSKYSVIKEKVREKKSGWVGALYDSQLPIIVFRKPEKTFRSQASSLARDILSLKGSASDDWFIGIGSVSTSIDQMRQSYHDALIAAMDTTLPVKYRFFADVQVLGDVCEGMLSKYQQKEFSEQIRLGHWDKVQRYVLNLIQCYEKDGTKLLHTQQRVLEVLWVAARVLSEMGVETATPLYSYQPQSYRELRTEAANLLDRLQETYEAHFDRLEADTIQQVKQYIMDHSHQDISLDILAKKFGLSPIYISKMFKEKQGINYIDYLTECRIEKAKKLMLETDKSLKEITFEIGYHDPNYFSKVFKKMCQLSPKEYRRALLGNKV